jgi:hypothetical protein
MEMRFPAITSAHATAIRLGVDLRIDGGAGTQIELRDGGYGVTVAISADGKLTDGGHVLAQVPLKQWFHLALLARFATEAAPATHDVTVTQHGADPQRFAGLATPNAAWNLCDWAVIYGPGQAAGRFFVDNLLIESVAPSVALRTVLHEDAEGPLPGATDAAAPDPFALLDDILTRYAPPPIRVTAPPTTRIGFFRSGKDVVVHAYDTAAPWQNWSQAGHGKIVLEGAFPLSSADLSLRGKPLPIVRQGNKWRVEAPVALYEVLTLRAN